MARATKVLVVVLLITVSAASSQTSTHTTGSRVSAGEASPTSTGAKEVKKNADGSSLIAIKKRGAIEDYRVKDLTGKTTSVPIAHVSGPGVLLSVDNGQKCYYCSASGTTMNCMEVVCSTACVDFVNKN